MGKKVTHAAGRTLSLRSKFQQYLALHFCVQNLNNIWHCISVQLAQLFCRLQCRYIVSSFVFLFWAAARGRQTMFCSYGRHCTESYGTIVVYICVLQGITTALTSIQSKTSWGENTCRRRETQKKTKEGKKKKMKNNPGSRRLNVTADRDWNLGDHQTRQYCAGETYVSKWLPTMHAGGDSQTVEEFRKKISGTLKQNR